MKKNETDNEIFRHLRPQVFDRRRGDLAPSNTGGISFMLKAVADKKYDYWIYICPNDIQFSARQSVKSLRSAHERGAIPWGTIQLDGSPLMDNLIESVIANTGDLPTQVITFIRNIIEFNNYSEARLAEYKSNMEVNRELYETR